MNSPDNHMPGSEPTSARTRTAGLEARLRARYRDAARALDPVTAARLRAARHDAMQAASESGRLSARWHRVGVQRLLLPAGAFAMLALATLMIWQPLSSPQAPLPRHAAAALPTDTDSELPPDPDSTDPALYQNLDFYDWLAASDRGTASHRP